MRLRLALLIAAAALVPGCRREAPAPPVTATVAPVVETRDGGRLVRRLESDVTTLNYLRQQTDDDRHFFAYLYDPLIELDREMKPAPGLATRWEISPDRKTYTFHLDPRATFSDGSPVLASDVVYTLNAILEKDSFLFAPWFDALDREQTKTLGDRTVSVRFKEPRASQLLAFNIGVLPEKVYSKVDFDDPKQVVGTGPYRLKFRDRNRSILLERREDYWRAKPPIASILLRPIADDAVAWRAMKRGDVDVSMVRNDTWWREKDVPAVSESIAFQSVWLLAYNAIAWNLEHPFLNDARVRRALAMSFDRRTVIDRLYHGEARVITGPFLPQQWANNPEVTPIEYNLGAAAALLSSAGWRDTNADSRLDRDGKDFTFKLLLPAGNATARDQAQIFQESLRSLGITMELQTLDPAAFFELVLDRNFDAAFLSWASDVDPDPYGMFHSSQLSPEGNNVVGYAEKEADDLIERARVEFDPTQRAFLYHQLHDVLSRDQPYLWIAQVATKWAVNKRVQNVETAPGLGLFLWYPGPTEWWLKEKGKHLHPAAAKAARRK